MISWCSQLYNLHEGIAFAKPIDVITPKKVVALKAMIAKKIIY